MAIILLTADQKRQLNEIYFGIVRKFSTMTSQSVMLDTMPRLTKEEAQALATDELSARQSKIDQDYINRCNDINTNAQKRGLSNSSVVIELLTAAFEKKMEAQAHLSGLLDKLTKKILGENTRLALQVEKEKSISRSRSLRDYGALMKLRLTIPFVQNDLIATETCDAYMAWLTQFTPAQAYDIANSNNLFMLNLGNVKYAELLTKLDQRRNN